MDIGDGYNVWMISWIVGVGRDVSVNSLSFFISSQTQFDNGLVEHEKMKNGKWTFGERFRV